MYRIFVILICLALTSINHMSYADKSLAAAITQPIPISQLADYSSYPTAVQQLILKALSLSQMNLTYLYGSSNPKNKGMDCSGTIYYFGLAPMPLIAPQPFPTS